MSIAYRSDDVLVWQGDCIELMRSLPDQCMDSVVTDPPYALEFMGKVWDRFDKGDAPGSFQHWCTLWAAECFRVLKPGGHLLAFGGTRTWHRLTAGIEDAGFEIRDSIAWLYGSGFPKSLDVSKAIDKQLGAKGTYGAPKSAAHAGWVDRGRMRGAEGHEGYQRPWMQDEEAVDRAARKYEGGTEDAQKWSGWGTALKPAFEPIVVARKPLNGTVAANVLTYGTGALNIDASRIGIDSADPIHKAVWTHAASDARPGTAGFLSGTQVVGEKQQANVHAAGRWPANVILDPHTATLLDQQSGERPGFSSGGAKGAGFRADYVGGTRPDNDLPAQTFGDTGGASRFFYVAKAPKSERPQVGGSGAHPTVKPLKLMQWLVRLVTPPGGNVLDPFAGSGTTVEACLREGLRCMAMERETDYLPLILHRIDRHKKRAANASDH